MSTRRRPNYRVPSTFHDNEVFELITTETEIMPAAPTDRTSVSSGPNTASGLATSSGEGSRYQLNVEKLLFEHWCRNVVVGDKSNFEKLFPSSQETLDELNAALAEALDEHADEIPGRVEDEASTGALPVASETVQSAQMIRNGIWPRYSQHRKDHAQHESAPSKVTRENGWISADTIANFGPEDVNIEALLPIEHELPMESSLPGPPHLSERVKGKLLMARS